MLIDRHIKTEDPLQKMWSMFLYYQNEPNVKELLFTTYHPMQEVEGEKQALRLAYENTHKFIYFLKQGVAYLKSAQQSDLIVRPLLLYYGVTSLMKAIILKNDPFYPRTTAVLQHGLTTRKKKKLHYQLYLDEIKVQKDGLLPLFAELILKQPMKAHSKYKVGELLSVIPELQDSYLLKTGENTLIPIEIVQHPVHSLKDPEIPDAYKALSYVWELRLPLEEISNEHNFETILELFQSEMSEHESLLQVDRREYFFYFTSSNADFSPIMHPQICRDSQGAFFFYTKHPLRISDELVVMNMLSYLLGMLCRYDTELWGELIFSFSSSDTFIIEEFLQLALRKFPNLILNQIYACSLIFSP